MLYLHLYAGLYIDVEMHAGDVMHKYAERGVYIAAAVARDGLSGRRVGSSPYHSLTILYKLSKHNIIQR